MATTAPDPIYTQLSAADQIAAIDQRTRDLEARQIQLALRIQAPAPGDIIQQSDKDDLAELENSLAKLRDMAAALAPAQSGGNPS